MLNHPTIDHLKALKLDGMAEAFVELSGQDATGDMSHAEWLGLLIDREAANRTTKRFKTRLRAAKLRHVGAAVEDIDYRSPRKLDKTLMQQLATCRWIAEHRNLLITGPAGSARHGWPQPSARRPAGRITPSSTPACRGSSPISNSPTVTVASRASSARSQSAIC